MNPQRRFGMRTRSTTPTGHRDRCGLRQFARPPDGALFSLPTDSSAAAHHTDISLAARTNAGDLSTPTLVADGGLISYGTDIADRFVKSASMSAASSKAPSPPICRCMQPTKFELVDQPQDR